MFGIAGVGAASIPSTTLRIALVVLLIYLSVVPVRDRIKHSDEAAWRDATSLAEKSIGPRDRIAVYPPYCVNVVRFYTPRARRDNVVQAKKCGLAPVLVFGGFDFAPPADLAEMNACYPRTLATLPLIQVRARLSDASSHR